MMAVLPQLIFIGQSGIGTQFGSSMWRCGFERLRAHRIIAVGPRKELAALVLIHRDNRGRRRRITLGVATHIDLVRLDDTLTARGNFHGNANGYQPA
jgi:hypothetical protein